MRTATLLPLALLLLAAPARAQEGEELARRLVQRIQEDMAAVDRLLDEAAATDEAQKLQDARAAHVRAISDLEELIRQVKYRRGQSRSDASGGGGGSSGQPPPRGADDRSQPEPAPSPQQPSGGEEQQQGEERSGRRPEETPQQDRSSGEQRLDGQPPPPDATADSLRRDTDARWGVLPPKLQERLMNLHVDDVPERYRTWLEAYVRELNRRDAQAGRP